MIYCAAADARERSGPTSADAGTQRGGAREVDDPAPRPRRGRAMPGPDHAVGRTRPENPSTSRGTFTGCPADTFDYQLGCCDVITGSISLKRAGAFAAEPGVVDAALAADGGGRVIVDVAGTGWWMLQSYAAVEHQLDGQYGGNV